MKVVEVPPTVVPGAGGLDDAVRAVFGPDTLRRVHGRDTVVGDFDARGKRAFEFWVDVAAVPATIRRFFCGSRLKVTTRQVMLRRGPQACTVRNKLRMHFVGAELFGIRPTFELTADPRTREVRLGGRVEHYALLPPPLDGIAEGFMVAHTRAHLRAYEAAVRAHALPFAAGDPAAV